MTNQLAVFLVFLGVFVAIILERLDKTLVALFGALLLIILGYLPFEEAMHVIDFNTICLLLGMMVLVDGIRAVRMFEWLALALGIATKGNPVLIFFVFGAATAVFSAFLDNVTTVLIVVPLVISLSRGLGLDPKVYVLCMIFLANIGGAATLIGDPPNILIGTQVPSLTFVSFLQYLSVPVIISCVAALFFLRRASQGAVQSRSKNFGWFFLSNLMLADMRRKKARLNIPLINVFKTLAVFLLVMLGFFTHSVTHVEPAVIALLGAVIFLIVFHKQVDLHQVIAHIEWPTLLFFGGLFVIVGTMEKVGLLHLVADGLVSITGNLWVLIMLILWSSALLSALVDNIPFVAAMIPVLKGLLESEAFASHPKSYLVWWALALGACFGGNGSMIGASANVVSCAIAKSEGIHINFIEFMRRSAPVTFLTIVISTLYLTCLYIW